MKMSEKPLSSKEASITLEIGESTLRKWCLAIEEKGYRFSRTEQGKRMFYSSDMELLNTFKKLVKVQNMSYNNAAYMLFSKDEKEILSKNGYMHRTDDEFVRKVINHIERQEKFNQELLNKLSKMSNKD
ncbi:hypothetical protein LC087_00710 [Bacillus carboniphilus]|uniref:HTH merR-type domain-containing protein n=1 Tax=Bacillus carboniphilus TaxID=86663 RepID=A0ABY9JYY0_9BACI|nr:hypothetical protein [Bacillus carboniphilus]WLR42800.1 hypothetical protein LC087_00710 [Bacillus carboniphilus]